MLNMIGVGPFLSIPLLLVALHGSNVLLAWILGAAISLCDGLVWAAGLADLLILVASFASVFAILLGYSRIPFAAVQHGEFFSIFARVHPIKNFPHISLLILGVLSAFACMLSLSTLISLVIVIQTMVQFLAQCVAVVLLRRNHAKEHHT